jgi:tetratricopeptide (TPR) repeat protein
MKSGQQRFGRGKRWINFYFALREISFTLTAPMSRNVACNFAALLLLFVTCTASARDSTEHWFRLTSTHFVVLTDSNEKQARHIASQLERMRAVFHTLFPTATADSGAPIIVLALKDRKAFQALEPAAYLAKGQLDLAGLFLRAPDKNYILLRLDAQGEHPFSTVYHEYTHLMTSKATWMPLWLNEGLAEFYQNTDIQEKDVLLGQPSADDILYLRQNRLLPLATLLNVDYKSPYYHEEQKGSVFYAESWALTHYLEVTDRQNNTHRLEDYVKLLSQRQDPVTAAQTAFGDLNRLQNALSGYVNHGDYKLFKMNTAVTIDESSFQLQSISAAEADAVRADVLIHDDRTSDAKALLETTLSDDPNNALAHESMGFLNFREGDIPSAKKWYGEAVQLDSHSYLAHYYFATMSMQDGDRDHDDAIEASLRTAIRLNPSFAPSYDALAGFYASRHMKLDEAHILNAQAVELKPDNINFRVNTAEVLVEQGQPANAIGVLKIAAGIAKTPAETALIQSRIEQVQQYQSMREQAQSANAASAAQATMVGGVKDGIVTATEQAVPAGPKYPTEPPNGPKHTVKGVLREVKCSYPAVITLRVDVSGKTISLYSNNVYKIEYSATNFTPSGNFNPCNGMEGMKARVEYAEVSDRSIAGQILSIELTK